MNIMLGHAKQIVLSNLHNIHKLPNIFVLTYTQQNIAWRKNWWFYKVHFSTLMVDFSDSSSWFLRQITWSISQQPKNRGHVDHHRIDNKFIQQWWSSLIRRLLNQIRHSVAFFTIFTAFFCSRNSERSKSLKILEAFKGQLISKANFLVLIWTKICIIRGIIIFIWPI